MFAKAGVDLTVESGWLPNLALGKPVSASFTTTAPAVRATATEAAVDGFTISGLPVQQGTYIARNTIWGTQGSPNAKDWFEVDLTAPAPSSARCPAPATSRRRRTVADPTRWSAVPPASARPG